MKAEFLQVFHNVTFIYTHGYLGGFFVLLTSSRDLDKHNITPGKLSQVPAEILIIGCDRHTEMTVTVAIKTIKGGYLFFFVQFIITGEVFENQRVLFDPLIHKVSSYVKSPRTLHIHERYDCRFHLAKFSKPPYLFYICFQNKYVGFEKSAR